MNLKTVVFAINEPGAIALRQIINCGFNVQLLITRRASDERFEQPYKVAEEHKIAAIFPDAIDAAAAVGELSSIKPDLIISSWYHLKIPNPVIKSARLAAINFHPSLLPKYRGATPVEWCLMNGETHTGLTCHLINERFDSGPILWQKKIGIMPDETAGELANRIACLIGEGLNNIRQRIDRDDLTGRAQKEEDASYYPKRNEDNAIIDWNWRAERIHNNIRAMNPRPLSRTFVCVGPVFIEKSVILDQRQNAEPGTVIKVIPHKGIVVACGNSESILLKSCVPSRIVDDISPGTIFGSKKPHAKQE